MPRSSRSFYTVTRPSIEKATAAVVAEPVLETLTVGGLQVEVFEALRARLLDP